ncbi:hypothetical protein [Cohnella sp.]|uniref:hypothetical protein n=1 Tax=Cohnella sp. TaxID=1883426 RepID=UPI003563C19A
MHANKQRKTGEIIAVLVSVWLGIAAMTASHLWTVYDLSRANSILLKLGSWIPGWWGIGPYAGKETVGLLAWLAAWAILHVIIRNREFNLKAWTQVFAVGFFVILIVNWPPVYHAVLGWLPAFP